ncbi:ribosome biogenesis GTP-binding protein YihA/YsxC [Candidatus Erwinia haradaeae]|uniref:Probable GTP-binding protein EngB n=1 Tax=Candidatus Erwinia haradaeae TaxID=1922217 RepID=A0A451D1R3_9GAMM|nr:ribosome biogenesis GTP-binding protein YihA/YsxC [Candidatus Erwinia haradaeae]VFP79543.1 Probable GTP-binding protein EngB [Candidatus Erwinia haradaeae]
MFLGNYHLTHFVTSAPSVQHLPDDTGIEVAFIGHSNSGKSSALNALTNNKKLARTSKTPGSTKLINLFKVSTNYRLVDLPGYGYSYASQTIKIQWQNLIINYLTYRRSLIGLSILMDVRHPLKILDYQMILLAIKNNIEVFILLTKADKLSNNINLIQLNKVRKDTKIFPKKINVELFSSKKKIGIDKLQRQLNFWYQNF